MKISKIKHGIAVGTEVPERQRYGNVGRWAESVMRSNGHSINTGAGCDMPGIGVEIKTRKIESTSPHSMGSMRIEDIIATPYEHSLVFEKVQQQYRIHYSDEGQVVVDSYVYDFSETYIQDKIREAYELGRKQIAQNEIDGFHPTYVRGSEYGQFEIKNSCSSYEFRIPNGSMKKIERVAKNAQTFKKLFE